MIIILEITDWPLFAFKDLFIIIKSFISNFDIE